MTETHKVKCDKCGIEKNMIPEAHFRSSYYLPFRWKNIKLNCFVNKDVCPKCKKEIKQSVSKLFKSNRRYKK